ncbi:MAG: glycosyltransferase family 2 protein [Methylocystis sp.]|uniref:glycosyltransferase family 2 protein n=1 Tax=Methylocystis sp. TaxID=1911079 RepID=UPI003DA5FA94
MTGVGASHSGAQPLSRSAPMGAQRLSLTVVILTLNEALHIERCLRNVLPLAERVIVVDSFSTDRTVEIARGLGADVHQRAFRNQADQFQWALDTIAISSDWVMRLDADEYLEAPLIEEMRARLPDLPAGVTGVRLKRKVIFRDAWIRWGGYYPTSLLRLWRNGAARMEQRWMDEHLILLTGDAIDFDKDFVDHNLNDITWWTEKHNRFATRQMVDFISLEQPLFPVDGRLAQSMTHQAGLKRFLRNKVFARAPLYLRCVLYFLLRYFGRLGFLDGRQGFVFHFLQGFWNWMLVDAKIDEARMFIRQRGLEAFKAHLRTRHGIDVEAGPQ